MSRINPDKIVTNRVGITHDTNIDESKMCECSCHSTWRNDGIDCICCMPVLISAQPPKVSRCVDIRTRLLCWLGIHAPGAWEAHGFLRNCEVRRCVRCGSENT